MFIKTTAFLELKYISIVHFFYFLHNVSAFVKRGEYCEAQPKLQVKHSLKAEFDLILINPTPTSCPPGRPD